MTSETSEKIRGQEIETEGGVISNSPHALRNRAEGASLIQVNTLSNPVLIILIVALVIVASISGGAIGVASYAAARANDAERESRLAQRHAERLQVEVNTLTIQVENLTEQ